VEHLTEAHDAAMKEYRQHRDGVVRAVQEQMPGTEEVSRGLFQAVQSAQDGMKAAGEATVTSGTIQADELTPFTSLTPGQIVGQAAAQAHKTLTDLTAGDVGNAQAILLAILRDLELIKLALGIARDEDGAVVRFPPAVAPFEAEEDFPWQQWYLAASREDGPVSGQEGL
jgi:hypothetical protein